jgi:hypothetical protein
MLILVFLLCIAIEKEIKVTNNLYNVKKIIQLSNHNF